MVHNKKIERHPEVASINVVAKKLIIFLHGLGADGYDLISLVPLMQPELHDYHFMSPNGIENYDMAPYGRQWFSVKNRDPEVVWRSIIHNAPLLMSIIEAKQLELNLTNQDTTIIGFSQGTMIGLYLTLIQKTPFASMIGFSGRLIAPNICKNTQTPICLIHGELDDVVHIDEMYNIEKYLSEQNIRYISHKIINLAHSIDAKGIEHALSFIKQLD